MDRSTCLGVRSEASRVAARRHGMVLHSRLPQLSTHARHCALHPTCTAAGCMSGRLHTSVHHVPQYRTASTSIVGQWRRCRVFQVLLKHERATGCVVDRTSGICRTFVACPLWPVQGPYSALNLLRRSGSLSHPFSHSSLRLARHPAPVAPLVVWAKRPDQAQHPPTLGLYKQPCPS